MASNPFSTGVGDIFGGIGDLAEASDYGQAATLEETNVALEKQSVAIQQAQLGRSIYQNEGAQREAAAANGLTTGGSAGDIFRSSVTQGALAHQLVGRNGLLQENSFQAQADAYKGMQSSLTSSAFGSFISGALSFLP